MFIPFTVGGGIRTADDARRMLRAGADKVAANTAAVERPELLAEIAAEFGTPVRRVCDRRQAPRPVRSGRGMDGVPPRRADADRTSTPSRGRRVQPSLGAGEILLTSMDRDGTGDGFDLELTRAVADAVGVPVIASGGVGTLEHLVDGIVDGHADAVLAASIFHYGQHTIADGQGTCSPSEVTVRASPDSTCAIGHTATVSDHGTNMEYRRLGRTGIKVSVLSFGSWVTFDTQVAVDAAVECMQAARDAGCNFFDNAEAYAGGRSEEIMGEALRHARLADGGRTSSPRSCSGASTTTST